MEPFFIWPLALKLGYTRQLCLTDALEPMRKRNIFCVPNYLVSRSRQYVRICSARCVQTRNYCVHRYS